MAEDKKDAKAEEPEEQAAWGEPNSSDLYCAQCARETSIGQVDHNTPAHGKDRPKRGSKKS